MTAAETQPQPPGRQATPDPRPMTDDTETPTDRCGEPTADGAPCQRPEGFGRDADGGPCMDHVQERPVLRKFTPERRERILGAAPSGAFKKHIAQMVDLKPDTLTRWLEMGETDDSNGLDTDLAGFYREWQRARGNGAIKTLNNCSDEFIAERAYGYTKKERHEHLVDDDADLQDMLADGITVRVQDGD